MLIVNCGYDVAQKWLVGKTRDANCCEVEVVFGLPFAGRNCV
jgi:hypothetical protein